MNTVVNTVVKQRSQTEATSCKQCLRINDIMQTETSCEDKQKRRDEETQSHKKPVTKTNKTTYFAEFILIRNSGRVIRFGSEVVQFHLFSLV